MEAPNECLSRPATAFVMRVAVEFDGSNEADEASLPPYQFNYGITEDRVIKIYDSGQALLVDLPLQSLILRDA